MDAREAILTIGPAIILATLLIVLARRNGLTPLAMAITAGICLFFGLMINSLKNKQLNDAFGYTVTNLALSLGFAFFTYLGGRIIRANKNGIDKHPR